MIPVRVRKLIGSFALLLGLGVYIVVAVTIADRYLPDHALAELAYYVVAGILWAFPAKYLMRWMNRPDPV